MSVNARDILSDNVRRLTLRYSNAEKAENFVAMRDLAIQIADLYHQLAELDPNQEQVFQQYSKLWEKRAVEQNIITSADSEINTKHSDVAESMRFRPTLTFADIGGCDALKEELTRTMVLSEIRGLPRPMKTPNVLLFGPPGSGKTLIANALANQLQKGSVFYNASLENLLSKYYGEASKQISALFDGARLNHSKSIIFLDEFDALGKSRGGDDTTDANTKIVTSLLLELDGSKAKSNPYQQPFTIGACNHPWDVDEALLSRFRKRIFVGLPDEQAISSIIQIQTSGYSLAPELRLDDLSRECKNRWYSGRDIEGLCNEAIESMIDEMNPHFSEEYLALPEGERTAFKLRLRPLTRDDFERGFSHIRSPLSQHVMEQYEAWTDEYGVSVN